MRAKVQGYVPKKRGAGYYAGLLAVVFAVVGGWAYYCLVLLKR